MTINRVALIVTLSFPAVSFPCILVRSIFQGWFLKRKIFCYPLFLFNLFIPDLSYFYNNDISSMIFKFYYSCFAKIFRILFYAGLI